MTENVWKKLDEAKADLVKRAQELKRAFIDMSGGMPPGGMPPGGDPAAAGMPPEAAGMPPGEMPPEVAPVDPAAAGGMPPGMDPAMAGMDPSMMAAMGGVPPMGVDPATAGMLGGMPPDAGAGGAAAGAGGAGVPEPTITVTLSQLWDIVTKVLGLAKKIGANGQGIAADAPAQPAAQAGQDAIKAAVIEALGDMGLNQMKMAQDMSGNVTRLEKELADEMAKTTVPGATTKLSRKAIDLAKRLEKIKGKRIKGYDSAKGFTWH